MSLDDLSASYSCVTAMSPSELEVASLVSYQLRNNTLTSRLLEVS